MIKLKSKHSVGNDLTYEMYDSEFYEIIVTFLDGKLSSITINCKKYLYPDILCILEEEGCDITMKYDIIIKESRFKKFMEGFEYASGFIETELKPFINKLMKKENVDE